MNRVYHSYLTAALIDLLIGGLVLSFPYVAQFLEAGNLGTISNGIFALVYILVCLFSSRLRIFKERRSILVAGCLVFSAGCLLMLLATAKAALYTVPALVSLGAALFYPALMPWMTEGMNRNEIVRTTGGYSVAWVVGYLLGPLLAGIVLASSLPFVSRIRLIFGSAALVSFLAGLSFLRDWNQTPGAAKGYPAESPGGKTTLSTQRLLLFINTLWIANFLAFFLNGLIRYVFTELGKTEGLSPFWVGNVNSILFGSFLAAILLLRQTRFWLFSPRWLLSIQLLAIPAILCFTVSRHLSLYILGAALFGILTGFTFYSSTSYSLMLEGEKDRLINLNEALIGLGGFLSALTGYLFAQFIQVKLSFLPGLVLLTAAMILQIRLFASQKPGPKRAVPCPASAETIEVRNSNSSS